MLRKACSAAAALAVPLFAVALSIPGLAFGSRNLCPTCDVIPAPRYLNVYWELGNWESDVAATAPDLTRRRIDQLVQALGHSLYFTGLAQYGVSSVSILPSLTETGCGPPPADIAAAPAAIGAFARCLMARHGNLDPERTVLNVFLPPATARDPADPGCTAPGEHDRYGSPVEVALIPIACNPSIGGLLSTVSHQMVEGATDAEPDSPLGWKTSGVPGQEIADECEDTPSRSVPFLFAQAASYWSNAAGACVSGWTPAGSTLLAPIILSGAACGTGKDMTITLTGTFGPAPWDLGGAPPQTRSLYVSAQIAGLWKAGNAGDFPEDAVGFGDIRWLGGATASGDTITLHGFDAGYGAPSAALRRGLVVLPGDAIDVSVSSPATGQTSMVRVIAPSPRAATLSVTPSAHLLGAASHIFAGGEGEIAGRLVDGGGCAVDGAAVAITSSDATDTLAAVQAVSSDGGQFQSLYTPRLAGRKTITVTAPVSATATVPVYPRMTSLLPPTGGAAGNQGVTLTGDGFGPGTTIAFGGVTLPASRVHVLSPSTVQITTPPSTLPGDGSGAVDVTATVAGVTSFPLAYRYVVPGKPVISFTSSLCGVVQGSVAAYRADGSALPGAFALSTPSALIVLPGAQRARTQTLPAGGAFTTAGGPITATAAGQPSLTTTAAVPLLAG